MVAGAVVGDALRARYWLCVIHLSLLIARFSDPAAWWFGRVTGLTERIALVLADGNPGAAARLQLRAANESGGG